MLKVSRIPTYSNPENFAGDIRKDITRIARDILEANNISTEISEWGYIGKWDGGPYSRDWANPHKELFWLTDFLEWVPFIVSAGRFDNVTDSNEVESVLRDTIRRIWTQGMYIGFEALWNFWDREWVKRQEIRSMTTYMDWWPVLTAQVFKKWWEEIIVPGSPLYDEKNMIWDRALMV